MNALKRRVEAILVRLASNEALDREQSRRGLDHERRIQVLEREIKECVKTLEVED